MPIPDLLFHTLEALLKDIRNPDQPVFDFSNFERLWNRARDKAGLSHIHFHDLRHTYASQILRKEKNLKVVQELLRHKDYRMTLRYAHLAPGPLRKAALTLDDTFANLLPQTVEPAPTSAEASGQTIPKTIPANPVSVDEFLPGHIVSP